MAYERRPPDRSTRCPKTNSSAPADVADATWSHGGVTAAIALIARPPDL